MLIPRFTERKGAAEIGSRYFKNVWGKSFLLSLEVITLPALLLVGKRVRAPIRVFLLS